MKLLLDENLSSKLVGFLQWDFPGSQHVRLAGLERATDLDLWHYARDHGFTIVSKDIDFLELSARYGSPPKVLRLQCGNQPSAFIADLLIRNKGHLKELLEDPGTNCILLG